MAHIGAHDDCPMALIVSRLVDEHISAIQHMMSVPEGSREYWRLYEQIKESTRTIEAKLLEIH